MRHVMHLCADFSAGGGGLPAAVLPLAEALAHEGRWQSTLAGFTLPEADNISISQIHVTSYGRGKLRFPSNLGVQLAAHDPDVLHLHGLWSFLGPVVWRYARANRVPVVVSPHGMLDSWALGQGWARKRMALYLFEQRILRDAACLHALNPREHDAIRAFNTTTPIATIANGIGLVRETDGKNAGARVPSEFDVDPRRMLLFLGRLHHKKGIAELLRAWALLREGAPTLSRGWRVMVAGWDDGGHLDELRAVCAELQLAGDVTFPGAVYGERKAALLRAASAFVLPSHSEGMPVSVLEAWSYGIPVFMTDACNLPDGFTTGAAFRITTDPAALARVLANMLGDREALQAAGAAGHALAAREFGWGKIAGQWSEVYDWVSGTRARPLVVHG